MPEPISVPFRRTSGRSTTDLIRVVAYDSDSSSDSVVSPPPDPPDQVVDPALLPRKEEDRLGFLVVTASGQVLYAHRGLTADVISFAGAMVSLCEYTTVNLEDNMQRLQRGEVVGLLLPRDPFTVIAVGHATSDEVLQRAAEVFGDYLETILTVHTLQFMQQNPNFDVASVLGDEETRVLDEIVQRLAAHPSLLWG